MDTDLITRKEAFELAKWWLMHFMDKMDTYDKPFIDAMEISFDEIKASESIDSKVFEQLSKMYIRDSKTNDGMLFCGCRKDDCSFHYYYPECKKCLMEEINKRIKAEF